LVVSLLCLEFQLDFFLYLTNRWFNECTRRVRFAQAFSKGGLLRGRVTFARDCDFAMRVVIEQSGKPFEGNRRNVYPRVPPHEWAWTELSRTSAIQPFYVVRDDGTRVRIEPAATDVLASPLVVDAAAISEKSRRRVVAELQQDAEVLVYGTVCEGADSEANAADFSERSGYRGTNFIGQIMRATSAAPLLISAAPLEDESPGNARRLALFAGGIGACAFTFSVFVAVPFVSRALGDVRDCQVEQVTPVRNGKRRNDIAYDTVCKTNDLAVSGRLEFPIPLHSAFQARVGYLSSQLGAKPTANIGVVILWLLLSIALFGWFVLKQKFELPWYRQKRVETLEAVSE
jgi:hypothetical protein